MNKKQKRLLMIAWILLLALIFASVYAMTGGIRIVRKADYEIIRRYARLDEVREILLDGYYQDIDEAQLIQGAIDGMTAAVGDEYTVYYTAEEMAENDLELNGEYTGVGLLLQRSADGSVEVINVYDASPASEAGILTGDKIIEINGKSLIGIDENEFEAVADEIRGESGTELSLMIERNGEKLRFTLVRGDVVVSNISWKMLENNIGYIDIVQFGGNVVSGFQQAKDELADARALIIDVRNNPGGLLDDVVSIADELLDGGLIVYMESKDGAREDFYAESGAWEIPLVVLTNEASASASEILAAAVQENDRGIVVGTVSFGKGIVQTLLTFTSDGAGLQYTFARYFTPQGNNIHKIGVTPDIIVENAEDFVFDASGNAENDAQLACAIEYLLNQIEISEDA